MEWLQTWADGSTLPVLTAFLLGLLTAISPCPMATNITAIGYISRQLENRQAAFLSGLLYTAGRMLAYSVLGAVLIFLIRSGQDIFATQQTVNFWGEILLPPALIIIGVLMLIGDKLPLPRIGTASLAQPARHKGLLGSFALGFLFALAFCPTSGLLYFGTLIPLSASNSGGYLLPVIYAFATGLPVMLVSWVLAFSMRSIGRLYDSLQTLRKWLNRFVACLFILVGLFYLLQYFGLYC